jgi:protein gp37
MPTKIEWCEETWNPITGCTPISEGCQNCYAKRMANRLRGRCGYPADEPFKVTLHKDRLEEPLRRKKPRRMFVGSMGDLFHEDVPDEFIARIWWVMGQCAGYLDPSRYRGHTFLILTKRPERMQKWLNGWNDGETRRQWIESFGAVYDWMSGPKYWPDVFPNVWLGVTAENQQRADERIPILLQIPAAARFVSVEPMLGPVDLLSNDYLGGCINCEVYLDNPETCINCAQDRKIDWIICGGESGHGARPMHPDWVRSLRDQCQAAGVPFFFKQWGEWNPDNKGICRGIRTQKLEGVVLYRIGKKAAGRSLDGEAWDEMPEGRMNYEPF